MMDLFLHIGPRNLPAALTLTLYAAANVVVLSFVPALLFTGDRQPARTAAGHPRLPAPWLLAAGRSRAVRRAAAAAGVLGLAVVIGAGLADARFPAWAAPWVGPVLVCGLVGNVWTLVNPWAALHDLAARGRRREPRLALPARLGAWPAAAVLLGFALLGLAAAAVPPRLVAGVAAAYTVATLLGMALFGREEWLERCEAFTALCGLAGRFGPVETERDSSGRLWEVWLRPWGTGLLRRPEVGWDRVVFVVLVLSTLAFDGLLAAGAWQDAAAAAGRALAPVGPTAAGAVVRAAGLLLTAAAFLLVIAAFARLVLLLAGAGRRDAAPVTALAMTLVPIALLYGAARLYGSVAAGSPSGIVVTGAETTWFVEVTLVVIGHAIAVHLAHRRAGERFRSARQAVLSQYPVLVLLVLYTMTSLWILAQPVLG